MSDETISVPAHCLRAVEGWFLDYASEHLAKAANTDLSEVQKHSAMRKANKNQERAEFVGRLMSEAQVVVPSGPSPAQDLGIISEHSQEMMAQLADIRAMAGIVDDGELRVKPYVAESAPKSVSAFDLRWKVAVFLVRDGQKIDLSFGFENKEDARIVVQELEKAMAGRHSTAILNMKTVDGNVSMSVLGIYFAGMYQERVFNREGHVGIPFCK